ncbi:hypothetical protein Y1Q_0007211 [Alligator mississippiensis]|uniref:Uncharacterized protein n=1 Tax=Alligator mississippiensis TaxID=8496 RepID=A0A151N633_ALLMI|nr:hypothetical protein Y1Q_0007211 [Alligator mississippiensis]
MYMRLFPTVITTDADKLWGYQKLVGVVRNKLYFVMEKCWHKWIYLCLKCSRNVHASSERDAAEVLRDTDSCDPLRREFVN